MAEKLSKEPSGDELTDLAKSRGPSRPTPELIKQFASLIEKGAPANVVCDYLGIPPQTFHSWIKKGTSYNNFPEGQPKYKIYGDFEAALRKAAAAYYLERIDRLHKKEKGWQRELAILERRDRKNFSKYDLMGGVNPTDQLDPDAKYA